MTATKLPCPHCHQTADELLPVTGDGEWVDGAGLICGGCMLPSIFEAGALREPTSAELDRLMSDELFRAATKAALLISIVRDVLGPEDDEQATSDHPAGPHVHAMTVSYDPLTGEVSGLPEGLPPDVIADLTDRITKARTDDMARMIRRYVTAEVANHVLSSYGNEQASMPSVTKAALISLIRLANQADDDMLHALGEVRDFRGYLLAVTMLAEPTEQTEGQGMKILEQLAGLRDGSEVFRAAK
jgi:hypothetical protein